MNSQLLTVYLNAAMVRALLGGVSDMTIWRYLNDPTLNFPKPIYIRRRRLWNEAEVVAWLQSQPGKTPVAALGAA